MEAQVEAQLREEGAEMDTDYWENVLREVKLAMARTVVQQTFDAVVRKRNSLLGVRPSAAKAQPDEAQEQQQQEEEARREAAASSASGRYSPQLFAEDEVRGTQRAPMPHHSLPPHLTLPHLPHSSLLVGRL